MATPISTTNVRLSELNSAPGGSSTASNMRFANMARPGWSEGPLGSNTYGYYTWGLDGTSAGADAIYGLTPTSGQFSLNQFKGLQYYFDGTPFDITFEYVNNLSPFPGPFPPPSANDVSVEFVITDSALNYSIFGGPNSPPNFQLSFGMPAGGSQTASQIPGFTPDAYPLVREVFWILRVNCDAFFGGGAINLDINGTTVLNVGLSPGQNDFDYNTTATQALTNSTGITLAFDVR